MNSKETVTEFKRKLCHLFGYDENLKFTGTPSETRTSSNLKESLGPREFLDFAIEDSNNLEQQRSRINCLSNCKRAIDSQVNVLVNRLGYLPLAKKKQWNIPRKLDFITDVGVIAPRILLRVNQLRNRLEHEHTPPSQQQVEDALDVATLFVAYAELVRLPGLNWGFSRKLTVKYDFKNMMFRFYEQDPSRKSEGEVKSFCTLEYGDDDFEDFYSFLVKTVPLMELKGRLGEDI